MSGQFDRHAFLLPSADVAAALNTNIENGLTSAQVAQLQQEYPLNKLDVEGTIPWHTIFIKQLCNAMILVRAPLVLPSTVIPCHQSNHYMRRSLSLRQLYPLLSKTGLKEGSLPLSLYSMSALDLCRNTERRRKWTPSELCLRLLLLCFGMENSRLSPSKSSIQYPLDRNSSSHPSFPPIILIFSVSS